MASNHVQSTTMLKTTFNTVRPVTMAAAAAAVRLQAMIHLHSVVPAGPFWRGAPDACEVSICAFKSLRQLDNVAWHSARWQNDLHSGESADDLTEIGAEIVLEATGNTRAIVRLSSSFGADWR
jgi:hypothetical protein